MDEDLREVMDGLDAALSESGVSQAEFAVAVGTSASRFSAYRAGNTVPSAALYLRALRLAAALREAQDRGWMTPLSTSREIARALRDGDDVWALKMTLQARDQLRAMLREHVVASVAWTAAPRSTGSQRWDALLAALTAHEFTVAGGEPPRWTAVGERRLRGADEWVMPSLLLDASGIRESTPDWLAERGIYAAERDLVTA